MSILSKLFGRGKDEPPSKPAARDDNKPQVVRTPQSQALTCYLIVFTVINAAIFVGNIVPYRANDGSLLVRTIKECRNET